MANLPADCVPRSLTFRPGWSTSRTTRPRLDASRFFIFWLSPTYRYYGTPRVLLLSADRPSLSRLRSLVSRSIRLGPRQLAPDRIARRQIWPVHLLLNFPFRALPLLLLCPPPSFCSSRRDALGASSGCPCPLTSPPCSHGPFCHASGLSTPSFLPSRPALPRSRLHARPFTPPTLLLATLARPLFCNLVSPSCPSCSHSSFRPDSVYGLLQDDKVARHSRKRLSVRRLPSSSPAQSISRIFRPSSSREWIRA